MGMTTQHLDPDTREVILDGQSGFSDDADAFMLDSTTCVITNESTLVYMTKEQVMFLFGLVESK